MKLCRSHARTGKLILVLWLLGWLHFSATAEATVYADRSPLTFRWEPSTGPVAHYNVYVSTDGASVQQVTEVNAPTCRLDVEDGGVYTVQVEAEDSNGNRGPMSGSSEVVAVALAGVNHPPVAMAEAPESAGVGDWVILDASGSVDPDADDLIYEWKQTNGPEVVLDDPSNAAVGFDAPAEGTVAFEVVVSDGRLSSEPAAVAVDVSGEGGDGGPGGGLGGGGCSAVSVGRLSSGDSWSRGLAYLAILLLPACCWNSYQKKRVRRLARGH
ncbi:MAG: hypothetical protein AB1640_07850 [bacterium]